MKKTELLTDWRFEKDDGQSALRSFAGEDRSISITIPYDAMIRETRDPQCPSGAESGFYPGGKYIYTKRFTANDSHVQVHFDGVYGRTRVYCNDLLLAEHRYGYDGFDVDLSACLREENILRVEVDNSLQPDSRWYTGSGIYRNVYLLTGGDIYINNSEVKVKVQSLSSEIALLSLFIPIIVNNPRNYTCEIDIEQDGQKITHFAQKVDMPNPGKEILSMLVPVKQPVLWSMDHPFLYTIRITLPGLDEVSFPFGIRTVSIDPVRGFVLNGDPIKLRGACIHHDNGIIGAETFYEAEFYRCKCLKEAGFNAIRSAHHPMSEEMLLACDRLGMLVMDELCDMWTRHKNPYDVADVFLSESDLWIKHMVDKDYNHPCVVLYSVGNEIGEAGTIQGERICRHLCERFRELDDTRFTTNALNGLNCAGYRLKKILSDVDRNFNNEDRNDGQDNSVSAMNRFMSLMYGEKGKFFATHPLVTEALQLCEQTVDVIGLNYLLDRYELEKNINPTKAVIGTETYPGQIESLWKAVVRWPHVIGDFTWAGYDYIGEAGVGIYHYDGTENFSSVYPERLAYIGDIDLIGTRRPISYYREIVYGLRKEPYITVGNMNHPGEHPSMTAWMWRDCEADWTWPSKEGEMAKVDVYSASNEVELVLNGHSLGKKSCGRENHFLASYLIPYEPGTLTAISYNEGAEDGRFSIITADKPAALKMEKVTENETHLVLIKVSAVDKDGILNRHCDLRLHAEVTGAQIEAFGSGNPSGEEAYCTHDTTTFHGQALLAIRLVKKAASIRITSAGLPDSNMEIGV
jgi:beta-galactosidase